MNVRVDPHPALCPGMFVTRFPQAIVEMPSPASLTELLALDTAAPLSRDEEVRGAVRDLLRHGGYKPTGRGKPASEYLVKAAEKGALGSINLPVDTCNAVSLHSGLPISVVDIARAVEPLHIAIAEPDTRYVFNRTGQEIDVSGLLCLFDAEGPCANAVKDAQRTKTSDETVATLSVVWGCQGHEDRVASAVAWYRELLEAAGATTEALDD